MTTTPSDALVEIAAQAISNRHKSNTGVPFPIEICRKDAHAALKAVFATPQPASGGVVGELLVNIKRTCVRGRNSADLSKEHSSFIASFDHIEDLAQQAIRALTASAAPQGDAVELTVCCGREECGGECGNEWRGMQWVRKATPPQPTQGEGVLVGFVHPMLLKGGALAMDVSRVRLSPAQIPVYAAPSGAGGE